MRARFHRFASTGAIFFWMKSATSRSAPRQNSCGSWKQRNSLTSAARRPICVDVRFITATNQDLAKLVAEGRFRQDLFYRINVFPIVVPPLRERREDIALLVNSFVHDLRETSGKRISGVTPEVMDLLMRYEWPGNVRELKSTLEYGVAIAGSGLIGIEHLPAQFRPLIESRQNGRPHPQAVPEPPPGKAGAHSGPPEGKRQPDPRGQAFGVHRMTVLNRMRKYGIRLHSLQLLKSNRETKL